MKVLFIGGFYPNNKIEELTSNSLHPLQMAPNNLQWALIDGFMQQGDRFYALSFPFLPSFPIGYKKLFTPESTITNSDGSFVGKMESYNTLIGYKEISIRRRVKNSVMRWLKDNIRDKEEKFAVFVYTEQSYFLLPLISLKKIYPGMVIGVMITDLIDDCMNYKSNQSFIKRIQMRREKYIVKNKIYSQIDKFVLLTKAMVERIPQAVEKHIVVEGIYNEIKMSDCVSHKSGVLMYSGTLESYSGIRELINSFTTIQNDELELEICGSGGDLEYVKQAACSDNRIKYLGVLSREKVVALQKSVTALINPRRPDNHITKYSFPSKTIEYMSSGTPMIGYKLEGIPEEYYDNMYVVEDISTEALSKTIETVLKKSPEELEQKGLKALNFILREKNPNKQVGKILSFLKA